jgi:hypothetical protein
LPGTKLLKNAPEREIEGAQKLSANNMPARVLTLNATEISGLGGRCHWGERAAAAF